jgi:hypothetical protein
MLSGLKNVQFISNKFGDQYLHPINGSTFNQIGSAAFYQSHFNKALFEPDTFYLIVGSDCGLLARYIMTQGIHANTQYFFIELHEVMQRLPEQPPIVHENIHFYAGNNWLTTARDWGFETYLALGKVRLIRSIAVIDAHYLPYQTCYLDVEQRYYRERRRASLQYASVFIDQQLKNLAENCISAHCLKNIVDTGTAIVLAGGPSLDSLLPWVKRNRNKLFIVAVSRISCRLQQVGLTPDIIVAINPKDTMFALSKTMLLFQHKPLFVHAAHVSPLLLGAWSGPHVYLGQCFPWQKKADEMIEVVGPTVTNAAIHLLVTMGFKQILLAGVDLSYSDEGYSHAKGSVEYASGPNLGFLGQRIALNNGEQGETNAALFSAIDVVAQQAKQAQEKGCQFINLSAHSAKIAGVLYQAPQKISLSALPSSISNLIDACVPPMSIKRLHQHYQACLTQCISVRQQLQQLAELANKALNAEQPNHHVVELQHDYDDLIAFIKKYRYCYFVQPGHQEAESTADMQHASHVCLNAYVKGSADLQKTLSQAEKRLQCRMEELSAQADLSVLCQQWQSDQQYTRASLWQERHIDTLSTLPSRQKVLLHDLLQQARRQLVEKVPTKTIDLSDFSQFKAVQNKIYFLFKQGDCTALETMVKHLYHLRGQEANNLALLAKAHIAECQQAWQEAIACYHAAARDGTMELALNKLVSLLLQQRDVDNALHALDALRRLSVAYVPQYIQLKFVSEHSSRA